MTKKCFICGTTEIKPPISQFIEEKQYQGPVDINDPTKQPANIIYYCSIYCMERQLDKREEEDFKKGKCPNCNEYLVVLNDKCQNQKHQQGAHYLRVKTPDCLKK